MSTPFESITYTLREPVIRYDTTGAEVDRLEQLTIKRRPQAGDFRGLDLEKDHIGMLIRLVARLSGTPEALVERMTLEDIMGAAEDGVLPFLPTGAIEAGSLH